MAIAFERIVPILRIFDVAKAREFYLDFLGFGVDWEHRFEPRLPLYMQVSRGNAVFHLSEHHGDGSPGAHVRIETSGVEEFQRELAGRKYNYMNPGVELAPWGELMVVVIDPFGNRLFFCQPVRENE